MICIWGNGTDDILSFIDPKLEKYINISFGKLFNSRSKSSKYLAYFDQVKAQLKTFKPDVIIYQSGAGVHTQFRLLVY